MDVLIVGAGAVGLVYGYHLQRGGARVRFLVKPAHVAGLAGGAALFRLDSRRRRVPLRFEGYALETDPEAATRRAYDQVWLCVPSPALRGPWLDALLPGTGDATIVSLQPGLTDRAHLLARVPAERLVTGLISLVAYQGPLPGETLPAPGAGVAFWFPPMAPAPFSGAPHRVGPVLDALRAGDFPATEREGLALDLACGAAAMMPPIAALEVAGWSLSALRRDAALVRLAADAAREGIAVSAAYVQGKAPTWRAMMRPTTLSLIAALGPRVVPFDLEAYLRFHFTKVGAQTRAMLATYVEQAGTLGLPAEALRRLIARL